ncbi:hypothetical protein JOF53_007514 [Crossiella equi]|uniref:DUF4132 domain-containing protein n=1 Tax=Crossiella equi TaxID=130796 RepID=A0ABS5APZ7_9PSEU|nr:DUF4132 domain-containing protein [Crossiella equi]MBP2478642.1 hypothetical protein [Crossiella equi]
MGAEVGLRRQRELAGELLGELHDGRYDDWRQRLAAEEPGRVGAALVLAVHLSARGALRQDWWRFREQLPALARLPFTVSEQDALLAAKAAARGSGWESYVPLRLAEALVTRARSVAGARVLLTALDAPEAPYGPERSSIRARLMPVLALAEDPAHDLAVIAPGDGWARAVVPLLRREPADVVNAVLRQLAGATGSRPGKAWAKATAALLGDPVALRVVRVLLERVADAPPRDLDPGWGGVLPVVVCDRNADVVRAAAWAVGAVAEEWVVPVLAGVAERDWRPGGGVVLSKKVGNAAVLALGMAGGAEAVAALTRLDALCRDNGDRKRVAAALALAGAAMGLTAGQVAERMVEDGGFTAEGYAEFERESVRVRVLLAEGARCTVRWWSGADWVAKVPAGAPESEVRALRRRVAEAKALVTAERRRVEGLFAQDRDWDLAEWRRYYLGHPVTGRIAERLLWTVDGVTGLPQDGRLTTVDGVADLPPEGRVRLWHPARAGTGEVAAWRRWLLEREFRQPVKQAFREVYVLTDAERSTGTYSNRFAAHILRYHQTYALFKERAWVSNFLGPYDSGCEGRARREFRDAGLVAVFEHFAADTRQHAPELCSTDRVWFHAAGDRAKTPLPLTEVPPLVFTEAMRDVDLFVGVSSIALDPDWLDRGDDPHAGYWRQACFGELSARAQVRREVLAHLLPKLAVADRVELGERFVRVRGRLGTYRVHIGSGNVLAEPDDRYLCIVPSGRGPARVLLPFEGDDVLSLVLSKVALLARDDRITDLSITSQLRARG